MNIREVHACQGKLLDLMDTNIDLTLIFGQNWFH